MSSYWSPKPLRPAAINPLFQMVESETVVKGLSPIQRQRKEDGTPLTRGARTSLRPADPELTLRDDLVKGSIAEKFAKRPEQPKMDPVDPISVVKAYMAWDPDSKKKQEAISKSAHNVNSMQGAIASLLRVTGAEKLRPEED